MNLLELKFPISLEKNLFIKLISVSSLYYN